MYFNYRPGYVEVITGCMFAGKTEELIRRLTVLSYSNAHMVVFKPAIDDRYDVTDIVSHSGSRVDSVPVNDWADVLGYVLGNEGKPFDVVAIDEVQFFGDEIVEVINTFASRGIRVIVAGLDLDFAGKPFGPMPEILTQAEFITKLPAVCVRCGAPATRSQRLVDGEPAPADAETVLVGANESYEARCRHCHVIIKKES